MVVMSGSANLCPNPESGYCRSNGITPATLGDISVSVFFLLALVENDLDPEGFEYFDDPGVAISSLIAWGAFSLPPSRSRICSMFSIRWI